MQKTDLIRSKKWAMQDAFLREVGVKSTRSTSMRSWDEPWEISPENRDRPGGHESARYYRPWKKADNRKARREHRKIVAEAVREFYKDHEYFHVGIYNWYDEFEPTSREQIYYQEWLDEQVLCEQMNIDYNDLYDFIHDW